VGLRVGLDGCGKYRPHQDSIPDRPARTESLYRLRFFENVCTLDLYRKFRLRTPPPTPTLDTVPWDGTSLQQQRPISRRNLLNRTFRTSFKAVPSAHFFRSIYSICYTDGTCTEYQHCAQLTKYSQIILRSTLPIYK